MKKKKKNHELFNTCLMFTPEAFILCKRSLQCARAGGRGVAFSYTQKILKQNTQKTYRHAIYSYF